MLTNKLAYYMNQKRLNMALLCAVCMLTPVLYAQTEENKETNTSSTTAEAPNDDKEPSLEKDKSSTVRTVPDVNAKTIALLKSQYPQTDIRKLTTAEGEFTALWRKDQSGDAFGAVLIVPADGQTANWPHTIDIMRTDLPKNGWSTLAIDIHSKQYKNAPARDSLTTTSNSSTPIRANDNHARIQAAIEYLHQEGQYNIILAGYGNSAARILSYAMSNEGPSTEKTASTANGARAIIMINAKDIDGGALSPTIQSLDAKELPIQDIVLGTHYLSLQDAEIRRNAAKSMRMEKYFQLHLMEPNSTVFNQENRLSRRIRGFLNKHAKGVEINRR